MERKSAEINKGVNASGLYWLFENVYRGIS